MDFPKPEVRWQALLAPYQKPEVRRSLWQVANTIVPLLVLWYVMYLSLQVSYWLTLLLAIPTAGFIVRTFIIFHDCCHGSFFKSRRANEIVGYITGVLTLTPYDLWKHEHAIHHATAGNLDRRGIGDVPTLTVAEYLALPWWKKIGYRIVRNPAILFTVGSFLLFAFGHRIWTGKVGRREKMSVIYNNLGIALVLLGLHFWIGIQAVLLIHVPVLFIAASVGVWMFYVQHNFDGSYWERAQNWDFLKAGLVGSSFYKLPAILQWFTGNIGFHHIHHLSPKIPNYNLPKCYRDNPFFQVKPLTFLDSLKSLGIRLYDETEKRMVGFGILKKYAQQRIENR
jgi:omega-6 fatty acid desaturase (delta-12 desaturase)